MFAANLLLQIYPASCLCRYEKLQKYKYIFSIKFFKWLRTKIAWAVVVAQLTARSLPIPEDPGSNRVIVNFIEQLFAVNKSV